MRGKAAAGKRQTGDSAIIVKPSIRYLNRAPDAEIICLVGIALTGIGNNPAVFSQPKRSLPALATALADFAAALQDAAVGGPAQTAIKNGRRAELTGLMRLLSN
jgi:hypothetical protein